MVSNTKKFDRPVSRDPRRQIFAKIVDFAYATILMRAPEPHELAFWADGFRPPLTARGLASTLLDTLATFETSPEASSKKLPSGELAELVFSILGGRGATIYDLKTTRDYLDAGRPPAQLITSFFLEAVERQRQLPSPIDTSRCHVHGRIREMTLAEWRKRSRDLARVTSKPTSQPPQRPSNNWYESADGQPTVTIITSVYAGARYIEFFLKNICSQSIFKSHCELIIIDAQSPDDEYSTISRYMTEYPNIVYRRATTRIGIYEAWNIAIEMARGKYCTNANLDDVRRADSLEVQYSMLETYPFADVVYQDVFFSFEENLEFDVIETYGFKSSLSLVSRYNLMEYNSPHNAPMWRKSLHEEIGLFNDKLKSAGDWEYWLRCQLAGKVFFKSRDAHVGYYVNPAGMSTQPHSPGVLEGQHVGGIFFPKMISDHLRIDRAAFQSIVNAMEPEARPGADRYGSVQNALRALSASKRSSPEGLQRS